MSLVSYLPPPPPPLHTSPQLTETQQCPPCTCWQPLLTLLFFRSHLLGSGKALPPTPCPPGGPVGILPPALRLPWQTCSVPPGPSSSPCDVPPHLVSGAVVISQGCAGDVFLQQSQKRWVIGSPMGSLFPSAQTHVQAGHCCLLWLCLVLKEQV